MDKKLLIILGILVLLPLISSQQIYPEDSNVDLKVPCYNNNTYCSAASVCNITIIEFDGDILVDNIQMTQNTAYHNYTLNTTQTAESGTFYLQLYYNTNRKIINNFLSNSTRINFVSNVWGYNLLLVIWSNI